MNSHNHVCITEYITTFLKAFGQLQLDANAI
jgi:hypothetical protein